MDPEVALLVAIAPMLCTPEYSSSAQLAGPPPPAREIVNDVEAREPPALADQISDLTKVPLFEPAWNLQTVPPVSVIELMEEVVLPRAQTATMVLPLPLV
jgi:hypothetical protein